MSYWKSYWNKVALKPSLQKQVQRDGIAPQDLVFIERHIVKALHLSPSDRVLDVCCGNGMITQRLTSYCSKVIGIDFSDKLIEIAKSQISDPKLSFIEGDACQLSTIVNEKFDKILVYFSFQYFNQKQAELLFRELKNVLKPDGIIFIGDIPDKQHFWNFYDSSLKRFFYFKQWLFNKPKMGTFWDQQTLKEMVENCGFSCEIHLQDEHLPHAHYRYDLILRHA